MKRLMLLPLIVIFVMALASGVLSGTLGADPFQTATFTNIQPAAADPTTSPPATQIAAVTADACAPGVQDSAFTLKIDVSEIIEASAIRDEMANLVASMDPTCGAPQIKQSAANIEMVTRGTPTPTMMVTGAAQNTLTATTKTGITEATEGLPAINRAAQATSAATTSPPICVQQIIMAAAVNPDRMVADVGPAAPSSTRRVVQAFEVASLAYCRPGAANSSSLLDQPAAFAATVDQLAFMAMEANARNGCSSASTATPWTAGTFAGSASAALDATAFSPPTRIFVSFVKAVDAVPAAQYNMA